MVTHLTVVLRALLSVLSFVTASWLTVKESIISQASSALWLQGPKSAETPDFFASTLLFLSRASTASIRVGCSCSLTSSWGRVKHNRETLEMMQQPQAAPEMTTTRWALLGG